jgi:hypothetical protein
VDELSNHHISTLLKHQGVYNGLLAVILSFAAISQNLLWSRLLLGYVIQILKLRQDVFFVEEKIIYPDLDDPDEDCIHVFATTEKDGKTITVSNRLRRLHGSRHRAHHNVGQQGKLL